MIDVARNAHAADDDLHRAGLAAQFASEAACQSVPGLSQSTTRDSALRKAALDALTLRQLISEL